MLIKIDFPVLKFLFMLHCQIGTEGIKHLIKGVWKNLHCLYSICKKKLYFR